jgi:hypothetical protein
MVQVNPGLFIFPLGYSSRCFLATFDPTSKVLQKYYDSVDGGGGCVILYDWPIEIANGFGTEVRVTVAQESC